MRERGHSPMSIARCLTGVSYKEIEAEFDFGHQTHPSHCGFSEGFYRWLMDDCPYTWRPDNTNAPDAPWSRAAHERH